MTRFHASHFAFRVGLALLLPYVMCGCDVPVRGRQVEGAPGGSPDGCPWGLVVVSTDYQSAHVALLSADGEVRADPLITSGVQPPGLSQALGGDVTVPTEAPAPGTVVLLDRYPASVLTWLSVETGEVRGQLSVATGFAANPHDYLESSDGRSALVTRFEGNGNPGGERFDEGNDLLSIDRGGPAIVGRLAVMEAMQGESPLFLPRADRMVRTRAGVVVVLTGLTRDFLKEADSRLVRLSADEKSIEQVLVLRGLRGCSALAVAPNREEVAVSCSGHWGGDSVTSLEGAGIARVAAAGELRELERFSVESIEGNAPGLALTYASQEELLVSSLGHFATKDASTAMDGFWMVDLATGDTEQLLASKTEPFTLGGVACLPGCGSCFGADAGRGVVHRWIGGAGHWEATEPVRLTESEGLPPRYLGPFAW